MTFIDTLSSNRRFGGIQRLYGMATLQRFQEASVCVVGVGGVGSWAVEALARSGIGNLTLIDLDNVAESNINRQIHALEDNLGRAKVDALKERILAISPTCQVTTIEDFVEADNLEQIFERQFDFVIDAIDQMRVKVLMAKYFLDHKQPFAVSGGAGGQRNPLLIKSNDLRDVTHDKLLANMRYRLRREYGFSQDKKFNIPCIYSTENVIVPQQTPVCESVGLSCAGYGSVVTVTASFGLVLANLALESIAIL